jgi:hypothetical protein
MLLSSIRSCFCDFENKYSNYGASKNGRGIMAAEKPARMSNSNFCYSILSNLVIKDYCDAFEISGVFERYQRLNITHRHFG